MENKLRSNALGGANSLAMGVAGTAPSFSISASLATLLGTAGALAPACLIYCGVIMLGITFAYMHLNAVEANAGASYAWVSRIFHKNLGFFAGWSLLVASALFMVSATIPAGTATVMLFRPDMTENKYLVTFVALCWLLAVSAVVIRGTAITGFFQSIMTTVEIAVLSLIIFAALFQHGLAPLKSISFQNLSPFAFKPGMLAAGMVIAIYFFWGWDVALNLNEETKEPGKYPGLSAVGAVLIITIVFSLFASVAIYLLDDKSASQAGANILFVVADKLFPKPWSYVAVLALMLSTVGTLETSILQFARTLFAQSRDGAMHPRWGRTHEHWRTPAPATALVVGLGCVLLLLSLMFDNIGATLKASIDAIGVQAACYYGLACFACAWHLRFRARESAAGFLTMAVWPLVSAVSLWTAAGMAFVNFDNTVKIIAAGSILLGAVPLTMNLRGREL